MKYDYRIKVDGTWYEPGEEVPSPGTSEKKVAKAVEEPKKTKTDLQKMSVEELRKLATENGIEDAENISGARLKHLLADKIG